MLRTANQYSASRGARKVNEGRSGVVRLIGFQVNPESSETQSCTSFNRACSDALTLNGILNERLLLWRVGRSARSAALGFEAGPGGAADAGEVEIGPGATPPRTRARPSPKAASRSRIPLGVTRFLLNPCSDRPPPAGPPGRARSPPSHAEPPASSTLPAVPTAATPPARRSPGRRARSSRRSRKPDRPVAHLPQPTAHQGAYAKVIDPSSR